MLSAVFLMFMAGCSRGKGQDGAMPYDGNYPQHEPYGTGVGVMPGRVVWVHDPASVEWDGSGYWWETEHFDEEAILSMVNDSVALLGGKETARDGWETLFAESKRVRGGAAAMKREKGSQSRPTSTARRSMTCPVCFRITW